MNYDQMRAALHGYIHRDDQATTDNETTALELSLQAVARRFFPRESWAALATATDVSGAAALPEDFGTMEAVIYQRELEYRSLREYQAEQAGPVAERPRNTYTLTGASILAQPEVNLTGSYFTKPESISGTQSNWLSLSYPDVWLHAAIAEQWRFLQDFEAAELTDGYWQRLAQKAMDDSRAAMQSGGAIRMKGR